MLFPWFFCFLFGYQVDYSNINQLGKSHQVHSGHFEYFTESFTKQSDFHVKLSKLLFKLLTCLKAKSPSDIYDVFKRWDIMTQGHIITILSLRFMYECVLLLSHGVKLTVNG